MDRKEAVVLVSRALACIAGIYALTDASYLPMRLLSLRHYLQLYPTGQSYLVSLYRIDIASIFGRTGFFLFLTFIFWNCGPRIARFLLPEQKSATSPTKQAEPDVNNAPDAR